MKLSEIKGERVFDVVADLVDPVANIAGDKEATEFLQPKPCPDGMAPREFMVQRIRKALPKLLRDHKGDLAAIIAVLKGVDAKKYMAGLTLAALVNDLVELFDDEEFLAFLA
jgi:hypothetical protein